MALSMTVKSRIDVIDSTNGITISMSKDTVNSASTQNYTTAQYQLPLSASPLSGVEWIELPLGDLSGINQIAIHITSAPSTFAGLGVTFDTTSPSASDPATMLLQGSLLIAGGLQSASHKIYVKNYDLEGAVTLQVVLGGVNA